MTVAEWIGTAIMLAAHYLIVGLLWSLTHGGHLASIVWWPVQMLSAVCMA